MFSNEMSNFVHNEVLKNPLERYCRKKIAIVKNTAKKSSNSRNRKRHTQINAAKVMCIYIDKNGCNMGESVSNIKFKL